MFVSIVIPIYNSEKSIEILIRKIELSLTDLRYEIVLVNDGSKDNSCYICSKIAKVNKSVKFINLSKNFGQHNAIMAGLNIVKGDLVVVLDDDLQTPPEAIPKLILEINKGYDIVFANYKYKSHSIFKKFGSKLNDITLNFLLNKPKDIRITSFFITRKFIVKEIIKYKGPYPFIGGLLFRTTDNISKVYIKHGGRVFGKTNYNLIKLLRLWINGFTNFSIKPLRISFILGCLCSISGFLAALVIIIYKLTNPNIVVGWSSILVSILILSGLQLIVLGSLGEYIGRIFLSINNHPQFIIRDCYNIEGESTDKRKTIK